MLKFRCEMSIGYESRKCTQAVHGVLLAGHKSTPVKHKHIYSPHPAAPHLKLKLCLAAGQAGTSEQTVPNSLYSTTVCPGS
jgi:hypothetical protein